MLLAAARRFVVLLALVAVGTTIISLALGTLAGESADRAVSLGFYLVGAFLLIGGFFIGNRGPLRSIGDQGLTSFWGRKGVRRATDEERREEVNTSAVYFTVGLSLILLGTAVDSRYQLY